MEFSTVFYKAIRPTWTLVLLLLASIAFNSSGVSASVNINSVSYLLQPGESIGSFIDNSNQLNINQLVDEEYKFRFSPWKPSTLNSEERKQPLWLRFPVTNNTTEIVHPVLSVDYQQQTLPTLFIKYKNPTTGKISVKPLKLDRVNTTTFTLLPDQAATVYLKTQYHPELGNSLKLGSFDQLIKQQRYKFWQTGLLSGLLISLILANAWMFLTLKQEARLSNSLSNYGQRSIFHLLLAIGACFSLIFMASWQGYLSTWLYIPIVIEAGLYKLSLLMISLTFCQLAINLFGYQRPLLTRFFTIFSVIYLITALWLPVSDSSSLNTYLLVLTLIGNVSFCLSFWLVKPHRLPISAWLLIPLTISQFVFALNYTGALGISTRNTIWLLIQALTLTLGLLSRPARMHRKVIKKKKIPYNSSLPNQIDEQTMKALGHEMRTPLNGVMGMSELLLSTQLSPKQEDYVQTLRYAGYELGNLINLLAANIKTKDKGITSDTQLTDIHTTVDELITHFRYRAEQQDIEIICFIDESLLSACNIDGYRVSLILEAFLFYGLNQSKKGEVALSVQKNASGKLAFELSFKNAQGNNLEEKYLSGEHSFSEIKTETTMSLNLYLATQLIRQLGGEIGKEGNAISFTLPCSCENKMEAAPTSEIKSQNHYKNMRVLIADDSATCRKVLRQQCQLLGIPVVEAEDGLAALAMIRNEACLNRAFDVVILDHHMPGLKGLQVAERINGDPGIDPMPAIIILTGISNPPSKYQSRKLGISSILTKPVTRFAVQRALLKALGKQTISLG
ncbi:response regulator [Endozoicomonas sp.]|uniref:response regulator n=1 Tax=Endozoicomonas sp. TaxID=1892382 RepID=UPI002886FDCD|nr:response regulator [Endozoicomonas sp.]